MLFRSKEAQARIEMTSTGHAHAQTGFINTLLAAEPRVESAHVSANEFEIGIELNPMRLQSEVSIPVYYSNPESMCESAARLLFMSV